MVSECKNSKFGKRCGRLVLLQLQCNHRNDEEESDPRNGGDESHVHLVLHEAPAARQDGPEG